MTESARPTLADEKRQATVTRILRSARLFVAERGLNVTVEEIAEAAGVSRRTLFRLFPTRDRLLAAAISAGLERYGELLPPYSGADWRAWLDQLCRSVHQMNDSCGAGYWQLVTRHDLPPELSAVENQRRAGRQQLMSALATTLWSAAGGQGRCPQQVQTAVRVHLSPHFTAAVTSDSDHDWQLASELARSAIELAVRQAGNATPTAARTFSLRRTQQ
jgi:AcrR family transcriptional regulator